MLYLLDANTLIDAARDYYPLNRIPQFWDWVLQQADAGQIKVPDEIFAEVAEGRPDELLEWLRGRENKRLLILDEEPDADLVNQALIEGYASDLNDAELEAVGNDPFLIAYALVDPDSRTVVTTETSKPSKQRQNRKIPDVCDALGVRCINTFQLIEELDFVTR